MAIDRRMERYETRISSLFLKVGLTSHSSVIRIVSEF